MITICETCGTDANLFASNRGNVYCDDCRPGNEDLPHFGSNYAHRGAKLTDYILHSEEDYEMHPNAVSIWITVDGISVNIERLDDAVRVTTYPRFDENEEDLGYLHIGVDGVPYTDLALEELWEEFGYVGTDDDGITDMRFLHFPEGIDREVIWKWFDERHSKGVAWLLNEYDKRT